MSTDKFTWLGMHEADIAITDFGLFLECVIFATWIYYKKQNWECKNMFITFFLSSAFAALFGGLTHAFFYTKQTIGHHIFWRLTLLSIVLVGWTMWMLAVRIGIRKHSIWISNLGHFQLGTYSVIIVQYNPSFLIAIASYLPAIVFLFAVVWKKWKETNEQYWKYALIGISITIIGTILHELRVNLHPYYFTRSALYHVIMMVSFVYMFKASLR